MAVESGGGLACIAVLLMVTRCVGAPPGSVDFSDPEPRAGFQVTRTLPIRVVDPDGQPVAGAVVIPWALRSSQGHGWWKDDDDDRCEMAPQQVETDDRGEAGVAYPYFRDVEEGIRTLAVSVFVDHADFAFPDAFHVDVPLIDQQRYEVKLTRGVPLELRPSIDGNPIDTQSLHVLWSDGRSWRSNASLKRTGDGTLKLPPMEPGAQSFLVARAIGERVSHFSELVDLQLSLDATKVIDVPLEPARRIEGMLSEKVPRPVTGGRIKVETLPPGGAEMDRVAWFTWVPIRPDGSFTIDAWPADEKIQVIALCDGFIASSGMAPPEVDNPRDPSKDPFGRPQVFDPADDQPLTIAMEPLVDCVVTVINEQDQPVPGVRIASWPNVGWWNQGSQVYAWPLVRCERLIRDRDYDAVADKEFPEPFQEVTAAEGKATLELPVGKEQLTVIDDLYELPVFLGRRMARVDMVPGETTRIVLRVQPKGTERLGEWDKLAGVVFGCSTREGRRICALPGVREKMEAFTKRFRDAKNQQDPKLLAEAYTMVAEAFTDVGDTDEAAKWRRKAAEQIGKEQSAR
jgi:hypothetical protein